MIVRPTRKWRYLAVLCVCVALLCTDRAFCATQSQAMHGSWVIELEATKKEDLKTLKSLSNEGNNLNQLTKIAKFLGAKRLENAVLPLLETMQNIINKLSDDWKNSKRKKL